MTAGKTLHLFGRRCPVSAALLERHAVGQGWSVEHATMHGRRYISGDGQPLAEIESMTSTRDYYPMRRALIGRATGGEPCAVSFGQECMQEAATLWRGPHNVFLGGGDLQFSDRTRASGAFKTHQKAVTKAICADPLVSNRVRGLEASIPTVNISGRATPSTSSKTTDADFAYEDVLIIDESDDKPHDMLATITEIARQPLHTYSSKRRLADTHANLSQLSLKRMLARLRAYKLVMLLGDSTEYALLTPWLISQGIPVVLSRTSHNHLLAAKYRLSFVEEAVSARESGMIVRQFEEQGARDRAEEDFSDTCDALLDFSRQRRWTTRWAGHKGDRAKALFLSLGGFGVGYDGGRARRVRGMLLGLSEDHDVVLATGSRKSLLSLQLQIENEDPTEYDFVYVENTTAPMHETDVYRLFWSILQRFRDNSIPIGIFIRDAHWLDDLSKSRLHDTVEMFGRMELQTFAQLADVLFVPTNAFATYLAVNVDTPGLECAIALPPAIEQRALDINASSRAEADNEGLTLLYAGGVGGAYDLSVYIAAIKAIQRKHGVKADFIVRKDDVFIIERLIEDAGLPDTRVLSINLDDYRPLTEKVLGTILIDGDYLDAAFPVKYLDYVQNGMKVVCFEGSAIAEHAKLFDFGFSVDRSVSAIVLLIERIISNDEPTSPPKVESGNTWSGRVAEMKQHLLTPAKEQAGPAGRG